MHIGFGNRAKRNSPASLAVGWLIGGLMACAAGCAGGGRDAATVELARRRLDARQTSMAAVVEAIRASEAGRPAAVCQTAEYVRSAVRTDAERTRRNPALLAERVQADTNRFCAQAPVYREAAQREFGGKAEQIIPTAITLFY